MTGLWYPQSVDEIEAPAVERLFARVGSIGWWVLSKIRTRCTRARTVVLTAVAVTEILATVDIDLRDEVRAALEAEAFIEVHGERWEVKGWTPPLTGPAPAVARAGEPPPEPPVKGSTRRMRAKRERERQASTGDAPGVTEPVTGGVTEPVTSPVTGDGQGVTEASPVTPSPLDSPPSPERENQKERENPEQRAGQPAPAGGVTSVEVGDGGSVTVRPAGQPIKRSPLWGRDLAQAYAEGIAQGAGQKAAAADLRPYQLAALEDVARQFGEGREREPLLAWLRETAADYRRERADVQADVAALFSAQTFRAWLTAGRPKLATGAAPASGPRSAKTAPLQPETVGRADEFLAKSPWKPLDLRAARRAAGAAE